MEMGRGHKAQLGAIMLRYKGCMDDTDPVHGCPSAGHTDTDGPVGPCG